MVWKLAYHGLGWMLLIRRKSYQCSPCIHVYTFIFSEIKVFFKHVRAEKMENTLNFVDEFLILLKLWNLSCHLKFTKLEQNYIVIKINLNSTQINVRVDLFWWILLIDWVLFVLWNVVSWQIRVESVVVGAWHLHRHSRQPTPGYQTN